MTHDDAHAQARELLGAHAVTERMVQRLGDSVGVMCTVGVLRDGHSMAVVGAGRTWTEALAAARRDAHKRQT